MGTSTGSILSPKMHLLLAPVAMSPKVLRLLEAQMTVDDCSEYGMCAKIQHQSYYKRAYCLWTSSDSLLSPKKIPTDTYILDIQDTPPPDGDRWFYR